jgi:hypothetical protein
MATTPNRARIRSGGYAQRSIGDRLEAFFLDNLGRVANNEILKKVARDPETGAEPENWHQRLSELRTDRGYTILTNRDRKDLRVGEYMMPDATKRRTAGKRIRPSKDTWLAVLARAGDRCEWAGCGLSEGAIDPVGGGTVRLTPDHKQPHEVNPASDPNDPDAWQALCGRHQVVKKNYWDDTTGKLNVIAIVQAQPRNIKEQVYAWLKLFFGDR